MSWFQNLPDARRRFSIWRRDYNEQCRHSSLKYRTPACSGHGRRLFVSQLVDLSQLLLTFTEAPFLTSSATEAMSNNERGRRAG